MGTKRCRHVLGQVRSIAPPAWEHRGLLWRAPGFLVFFFFFLVSRVPFATTFVTQVSSQSISASFSSFPQRSHLRGRRSRARPSCPGGHVERQQSRSLRGGAVREKAHCSQWDKGAGPAWLHEALHVRLRRGGAGRGREGRGWFWPGPGRGGSVPLFGGLCPG